MKKILVCIYILLLIPAIAFSQKQAIAEIDSTVYAYYQRCLQNIFNPVVLSMSDTLFDMARLKGDARMQAVALTTKLDYYHNKQAVDQRDSIIVWTERVKKFAKQTNQPKYYFFVWGSRLIHHYTTAGEYNIALFETQKMLEEAEAWNYKEGVADCYSALSNIYTAKHLQDKNLEYIMKEIEIFEEYQLERYNISVKYSAAAKLYAAKGETDLVPALLEKAMEYAQTSFHTLMANIAYATYYMELGDMDKSKEYLDICRKIYEEDKTVSRYLNHFYQVEVQYLRVNKRNQEALAVVDLWEQSLIQRNQPVSVTAVYKVRADIYWDMQRPALAGEYYKQYIERRQKENEKYEEVTTAEFATLLGMQQLNTEKLNLEQLAQSKQLQNTQIIIVSLVGLLCIVLVFIYHQGRMTKKLQRSRDILDEKNRTLYRAKEELKEAKELAEESSRAKTAFIQNMSHEIRTPLNSIVGFSGVLAEMFSDEKEDARQYASLIENNSQLLLKLLGDILEISTLDDSQQNLEYTPIDINKCCTDCINSVREMVANGVELIFAPGCDELIINSNGIRIVEVLVNLLTNAAKFTNSGSIILAYTISEEKRKLVFTVTDTGIGIPEDKHEKVFERFVKLNEFSQGTGLGLAISRIIAEKLGGSLTIDKKYTTGARFLFTIRI